MKLSVLGTAGVLALGVACSPASDDLHNGDAGTKVWMGQTDAGHTNDSGVSTGGSGGGAAAGSSGSGGSSSDGTGGSGGSAPEPDASVPSDASSPSNLDAMTVATDSAPVSTDAPSAPAGTVPLFVAQGDLGLTTVSCDDGHSWVANESDDNSGVCFAGTPQLDCDHSAGAGRGITYGNGWFVAGFGWGTPGAVRRSRDGVTWEKVTTNTTTSGVAFGNGIFIAGARPVWTADSNASGWKTGTDPNLMAYNVRNTAFLPVSGGRFALYANSGGIGDTMLSSDSGKTWWRPGTLPMGCNGEIGGFAFGNGVIVMAGAGSGDAAPGVACRSTDGGMTWTLANLPGFITSPVIWTGSTFITWGDKGAYRSSDGQSWTAQATTPGNLSIGAVARSAGGTFVAAKDQWQQWYDKQAFYRSQDGVTWEVLAKGTFVGSHPIKAIAFGFGQRPAACQP